MALSWHCHGTPHVFFPVSDSLWHGLLAPALGQLGFGAMGAQLGALLKAACVAVNGLGVLRAVVLYPSLPVEPSIPMKFGIFGEVKWCKTGRPWFLLYPGLSLLFGLTPFVTAFSTTAGKMPEWVKKPEIFKEIMDITTDATCLCTGALMLLIIEQMPSMVQQQTGLPRYATVGFMTLLTGTWSGSLLLYLKKYAAMVLQIDTLKKKWISFSHDESWPWRPWRYDELLERVKRPTVEGACCNFFLCNIPDEKYGSIYDSLDDHQLIIPGPEVVGDNLWIWRADHAFLDADEGPQKDPQNSLLPLKDRVPKGSEYYLTAMGDYPAKVGVHVKGDFVTIYGLAVEHFTQDNTVWDGEAGRVYFYQNELPYDVDQENFGDKHYAGYRVASTVQRHEAQGVGVYSYFRDFQCLVRSGFVAPSTDGVRFTNVFTRFLNGKPGIEHVLNDQGTAVMGFSDPMSRLPTSIKGPNPTAPPKHRGPSLWSLMLATALIALSLGWLSSFFFVRWRSRQRGGFVDGASESDSDKC
eukprot:s569_g14.t4